MVNLLEHAKREFVYLGYTPLDIKQEDDPNKWIQENVLELLEVFSKQGHSGSSAPYCIEYFRRLASWEPLAPIKCTDDEWGESLSGDDTFQNKRLSSVFKKGKNGFPYYLSAIVWKNEKGHTYTGSALDKNGKRIGSSHYIKLPFNPKTFYIDVIEEEISKDNWEFHVKEQHQLKEVFEYYNRKN